VDWNQRAFASRAAYPLAVHTRGARTPSHATLAASGRARIARIAVRTQVLRKSFGIGSADWDDVLDDKVIIKFHIISNR
jgi:hypothetical protein